MTTLMQGLIQVSGQPLVHALGWTLLHFCWEGTAVAIILWCVLGLLGGRAPQARYGAACLALALMVALPLVTFARIALAEYAARATISGTAVEIDPGVMLLVGGTEPAAPWPVRIADAINQSIPWVLLVWLMGLAIFVARLNVGLMVARRMKSAGTHAPPDELQRVFDDLKTRLGVAHAVRLMHSALVEVPTVIGWLRPVVLIPVSCLTGLSAAQIEAILCHELAHVRRHDYLVSVLQSVVEALLFYHPAVWWVSKQVRRERECCCDELAVGVGGDVLAYARALSALEERRARFPEFVLGANGGVLKMRIQRLLGRKESAGASHFAAFTVLAVILAVTGSYVATVARAQAKAKEAAAALSKAPAAHEEAALEEASVDAGTIAPARTVKPSMQAAVTMDTREPAAGGDGARAAKEQPDLQQLPPEAQDAERQALDLVAKMGPEYRAELEQVLAVFAKVNTPEFRKHLDEAMSPELKQELADAIATNVRSEEGIRQLVAKVNSPEFRQQWAAAMAKAASADSPELRKQLDDAMKAFDKVNTPEYRKMLEDLLAQNLIAQGSAGSTLQSNARRDFVYLMPGVVEKDGTVVAPTGISGTIVDPHGAPVLGAKMTATNTDTGVQTMIQTDNTGSYSFATLPPGPYNVEVEAKGFQRMLQENIQIKAGQWLGMNLKLTADGQSSGTVVKSSGQPDMSCTYYDGANRGHAATCEEDKAAAGHYSCRADDDRDHVQTQIGCEWKVKRLQEWQRSQESAGLVPQLNEQPAQGEAAAAGLNIRTIEYKGLNSVTIADVGERFQRDGIGLRLETAYDPARIARAAASMKGLLAEHGHPAASVRLVTKAIPPGAIGILFDVKEGPKAMMGTPISYRPLPVLPAQVQAAAPAAAQGSGAISGTVYDPTGALVPRAKVTATNTDNGVQTSQETGNTGSYLFSSLPSGPYNVEFEAKGFERTLQENVQVKTGQTVGLNIKLRVGGENTTLTIKDKPLVAAAAPPTPPPPAASAGKPVGPQRVSSGVIVGNLISKVDPVYPDDAKRAHLQGTVVLVALIAKDGTVKDVQAEDGPPRLMVSAIDAVRQWRYKPSLLNGEPTEVNTVIRIEFKLDDASATVRPGSTEVAQAEQEYRDTLSAIHAAKKVGGGVSAPMPIYQVEPEYSEEAKQAKFMGIVLVGLVVDANGSPQDVHVVRGVGLGLNDKAIEAVKQYKFKPAMEDGKPVAAQINIEVNFKIF